MFNAHIDETQLPAAAIVSLHVNISTEPDKQRPFFNIVSGGDTTAAVSDVESDASAAPSDPAAAVAVTAAANNPSVSYYFSAALDAAIAATTATTTAAASAASAAASSAKCFYFPWVTYKLLPIRTVQVCKRRPTLLLMRQE